MSPLGLGWPNVISIFRILLAPVLVVLVLSRSDTAAAAAAAVFVFSALTDGLDGYLLPLGAGADPWRLGVLWATVVLTVWSGLDYFWKAARRG